MQADLAQLQKVPGIGAKTAEHIRSVIEADYRDVSATP